MFSRDKIIPTIRIAKTLALRPNSDVYFLAFWKALGDFVKGNRFPSAAERISLGDFSNLLFACSHMEFDKQYEWPILVEAFCKKLKIKSPDQQHVELLNENEERIQLSWHTPTVIKCMLSFKLADVGDAEDFWQPLTQVLT